MIDVRYLRGAECDAIIWRLKNLGKIIRLKSLICLQLWKTLMMMWTSIEVGKVLEITKASARESLEYCELKQYKIWFDEECSELLDEAKLQRLQNPSQKNGDNLNNVKHEIVELSGTKKEEEI
jgi:hypothetical protein